MSALKEARLARGLTQQDLAHEARTTIKTIYLAEARDIRPGHHAIRESIARALGVDADDLWPGHDHHDRPLR